MMVMRRFVAAALALAVVGTFCPRAVLGADPEVPEAWKSLDPDGLRELAVELYRKGEAGQAERQLLVGYLAGKYFGSAEQARQPGTGNWREYVRHLRAEMPDATKASWATKLRAAFTTVDLTMGEVSVLSTTLADLGDAQPASVAAIQVTQRTGWKSWKPSEQVLLVGALTRLGEAGAAARKLLADHLTAQCLSDAAATRSVPLTSWRDTAKALKDDLSAQQRQVWIARLRGVFAESELDANQFGCLVLACRYLGDAEADALAAVRVTKTTSWKSSTPSHLWGLASRLSKLGEAGAAARAALAAHVQGTYLASAAAARSLSLNDWEKFVRTLQADLSAQQRESWASALLAAHGGEEAKLEALRLLRSVLARLSEQKAEQVAVRMAQLGDAQAARQVEVEDLSSTDAWKYWTPHQLAGLAARLTKAGASKALLLTHIKAKYLSDAQAARKVSLGDWLGLARPLAKDLSAEDRSLWLTRLQEAYAGTELKSDEFGRLVQAYEALGGEPDPLAAVQVTKTTGWKSWKPSSLLGLADRLSKLDDAGKTARVALAAHLASTYLASAEAARSVSLNDWNKFIRAVGGELPAEAASAWASALQAAFLGDELNSHRFRALAGTVRQLDKAKAAALPQALLTQTAGWKAWPPKEVILTLRHLIQGKADTDKAARAALVSHFTNAYLSSAQATCSIDCGTWSMVAGLLSRDLTAEQRVQWIKRLREAFLASQEAMVALGTDDIRSLTRALKTLGDQNTAELAAAMARRGEEWKTWPPEALVSLARELARSATGRDARIRLAEHLMTKYLASRETARLINCQQWSTFAGCLGKDISAEQRGQWATKLKAAYAASVDDLKALKFAQLKSLGAALGHLDRRTAAEVVLGWFGGVDEAVLGEISAQDLASVGTLLSGATDAEKAELAGRFNTRWEAAHQAKPLSWGHSSMISYACLQLGDMAKARTWAMRSYSSALGTEEARNLATPAVLDSIARMLQGVGLTGKGKDYPAFATAAARLAKQGRLEDRWLWFYESCALPLGTAEMRQTLQAELTDAEGQVRLGAAQVLTWAYRQAGELKSWQALVEQKVSAAGTAGDAKAGWLLARAYVACTHGNQYSPLAGRQWLDQALAAAASAACKFRVVETLVRGHASIGKHDVGLSLLDSVAGQFAGTELAAEVEALRKETQDAKARYLAQQARYEAEHARRVKEAWKAELYRRLAEARQRGDREAVQRIEAILQSN